MTVASVSTVIRTSESLPRTRLRVLARAQRPPGTQFTLSLPRARQASHESSRHGQAFRFPVNHAAALRRGRAPGTATPSHAANTVTTVITAAGPHRPDLPVNATNQPLYSKKGSVCRFVCLLPHSGPAPTAFETERCIALTVTSLRCGEFQYSFASH